MARLPAKSEDAPVTEGRWVMSSHVRHAPWLLTFYIGAIPIAEIYFVYKKPFLKLWDREEGPFDSVSAAMRRMHELLKSPPED
jgi:hypothetical protein